MYIRAVFGVCAVSLLLTVSALVHAVPPVLSDVIVTNVTDRSLSLVLTSDQVGQASIEVYTDSNATIPATGYAVDFYPVVTGDPNLPSQSRAASKDAIVQAAQSFGIVNISVVGLNPDTDYYLKYSLQTPAPELTLCPDAGLSFCPDTPSSPLLVHTALAQARINSTSNTFFENDFAFFSDQQLNIGELLIIGVENARYPLSVFVGDGMSWPNVLLDLNNLFSQAVAESMQIKGGLETPAGNLGEAIVVRRYRGTAGSVSELRLMSTAQGDGSVIDMLPRFIGDCNGDAQVNGYDALLISHAVAGTYTPQDYAAVAFHPVLCDLFSEQGLHNVMPILTIDNADKTRVDDLLVGKIQASSLPDVP